MTTGPDQPPYGEPTPPSPYQPSPPPSPQQQPGYPAYGAPPAYPAFQPPPPNEGLGVAAMVVGIVSLVLACAYGIGLLGSPVALIMGRISMKRIDQSNGQLGGRGMAQAGFILGIVGTIFLVLALIAVVVIIIAATNGAFDSSDF